MRRSFLLLLFGTAVLLVPALALAQSHAAARVAVHRGSANRFFGSVNTFRWHRGFGHRYLPYGRFEGYCCVALPGDTAATPGVIVINTAPNLPPPPRPTVVPDLHFSIEKTAGVTIVRGPPILP